MAEKSPSPEGGSIFEKNPKKTILGVCLVLVAILEIFSGVVIYTVFHATGSPKRIDLFKPHPIFYGIKIGDYGKLWSQNFPTLGFINRVHKSPRCGFTTDSHGFIHNGDEHRKIARDDYTIFILGGSTVAGHGSTCNDKTIPAYLEKLLRRKYPGLNAKVVNAGVSSYFSAMELNYLLHFILKLDPDVVVSFSGSNDLGKGRKTYKRRNDLYHLHDHQIRSYETLESTHSLRWAVGNVLFNIVDLTNYTYTGFLMHKVIALLSGKIGVPASKIVGRLTGEKRNPNVGNVANRTRNNFRLSVTDLLNPFQPSSAIDRGRLNYNIAEYLRYITFMNDLVVGQGNSFLHMFQPSLLTKAGKLDELESEAKKTALHGYGRRFGMNMEQYIAQFRMNYFDQLRKTNSSRLNKVKSYDLSGSLDNEKDVYFDQIHYTDTGNRLIAEKMINVLESSRVLPQKQQN